MNSLLFKAVVTAVLVVAISELGKRSTLAGALLASLPLTSLLALVWLYRDTGDAVQAATLAGGGSWPALGAGVISTLVAYGALLLIEQLFDLRLFG